MKMKRDELKANAEKLRDEAKVRMDKVMKELKAGGDFSELAKNIRKMQAVLKKAAISVLSTREC